MSSKSHVSLEQAICVVCCKAYDTGGILIHKRLKQVLEHHTVTHIGGMCPECDKLRRDGYIAIVGAEDPGDGRVSADPAGVHRTGEIVHIRASVWPKVFNAPAPEKGVCFATPDTIDMLRRMAEDAKGAEETEDLLD